MQGVHHTPVMTVHQKEALMRRSLATGLLILALALVPPAGAQTREETLIYSLQSDVDNWDPPNSVLRDDIIRGCLVYDHLPVRDLKTRRVVPNLATSWTNIDDTTWEVKLRQGVKFHDGTPFTARDVKATFDRVLDPTKKMTARGNHAKIKAVDIIDDHTVRFRTDGPYPLFVERLTAQVMQSDKVIREKGHEWMQEHPVGTGPYKLVKWNRKQEHQLVRNDDYWGPKPAFKHLRIRIIPEKATEIAELLSGGVDIIKAVPPDQMDVINKSGQARTGTSPILRTAMLQLDQAARSGPNLFTDRRVRQAANLAVDNDAIIKFVLNGLGDRVATGVNPMAFGWDPGLKPYTQDLAQAKKLLAEAGYPNGVDVLFNEGPPIRGAGHPADQRRHHRGHDQGWLPREAQLHRRQHRARGQDQGRQGGPDVQLVVGLLLRLRCRRDPLRRLQVRRELQLLLQPRARRPHHPGALHARPEEAHRGVRQGAEAAVRRRCVPLQVGAAGRVGHLQPDRVPGSGGRGRPHVPRDAQEEVGCRDLRPARPAAPVGHAAVIKRYALRQVVQLPLVIVGISILAFAILHVIGDPVTLLLPQNAGKEEYERYNKLLGLDQPVYVQYWKFASRAVQGDFGKSWYADTPAFKLVMERMPPTLYLTFAGLGMALLISLPLGILAALKRHSLVDNLCTVVAVAGQAMPLFWLGIMLIIIFAVRLKMLPASGYGTWQHFLMPAFTLGAFLAPITMRLVRSGVIEVMSTDYIKTARAKGVAEWMVVAKHAFRNACIPVITVLGLQFGQLLGGAVVTETVFAWPGVATLTVDSIRNQDFPVVQCAVVLLALIIVAVNFLVDMIVGLIDPRIRVGA